MEQIKMNYNVGNHTIVHEDSKAYNNYHHFVVKGSENQTIGNVDFQQGPIKEVGENGLSERDLLEIVKYRLENFQKSPFACTYNSDALNSINNAIKFLDARTADRIKRNVEGRNKI